MSVRKLLLVHANVPDSHVFLESVNDSTCAVRYSSENLSKLLQLVRDKVQSVDRIAIVSRKSDMFLGKSMLECKEELVSLCMSLRTSRLDFLACNTLPDWHPFYTSLEESGLVVGASSDQTGNLKYGGNWLMENTKEDIQGIYFTKAIEYYNYLLDIKYDITVTTSSVTDMTVLDAQINGYGVNNIGVTNSDDGFGTIVLPVGKEFLYNGTEYREVYPNTNGALFFNANPGGDRSMFSILNITRDAVFPMFGDCIIVTGSLRYSLNDNILSVVYNPRFYDGSPTQNKALFSVTLYLKTHPDSGKIVFEYGTIMPSAISTNGESGRVNMGFALTGEFPNSIVFNNGFFTDSTNNSSKFHKVFIDTAEKTGLVQRKIVTIRPSGAVTIPVITFNKPTLSSYQTVLMGSVTGGGAVAYVSSSTEYMSISGSTLTVLKPLDGPVTITASSAGATSVVVTFNPSDLSGVTNIPRTLIANFPSTLSSIQTPLPVSFTGAGTPVLSSSASNVIALENVGDSYFVVVKSNPTVPITVSLSIGQNGNYAATNTVSKTYNASDVTFDTNICFPERTPILTDQGLVPIEQLKDETIQGSRIVHVTKTVHTDSFLVCFEKDALGENLPSMRTVMSSNHGVEKDGVLVEAIHFVNDSSVHKIQYNKEPLYNVLLETHSVMNVNGLICETLNPSSEIGQFYMHS